MTEPKIVQKLAIEVLPYRNGIWCEFVEDGKPFVNTIEHRGWSDDCTAIWFMLGTHNFYRARPYELINVVEITPSVSAEMLARWDAEDAENMRRGLPKPFDEGEPY